MSKYSIGGKLEDKEDFNNTIKLNKILLVEGQDEVYCLNAIINYLDIRDVEIRDVQGVHGFAKTFEALTNIRGFNKMQSIGFIRDTDDKDAEAMFESIKGIVNSIILSKTFELGVPQIPKQLGQFSTEGLPRIGIYLMPNNSEKGSIETLFLASVREESIMGCISCFFDCCTDFYKETIPKNDKARMQAYLATKKEFVDRLGFSANGGKWDYGTPAFGPLIKFLREM